MPNFYEVLGIASGAGPEQVKAAFHRLAKSSHPDVNAGDATAEKRFKEVNQAYEILSEAEKRTAYDLGLEHERAKVHRHVRKAMAAMAASFMVTVWCGLYFLLQQDSLRQRAEGLADTGSHASDIMQERVSKDHEVQARRKLGSAPSPQSRAEPRRQDGPAAASSTDELESTFVPVGERGQTAVAISSPSAEETALAGAKTVLVVAPASSTPDHQAERERALRLYVEGLQQIESGDVNAARLFFDRAADAGLCISAVALAGTYDPAQLSKLKVLGVQPDVEVAGKWYEKARDLCASEAHRPEGASREDVEFLTLFALSADKPAADPDLAQFRAAYTSGDGLAYVVIKDEKSEHIYRYGDESRLTAKKDTQKDMQVYKLFTCNAPHLFTPQKAEDNAALLRATVVKFGDPRFTELDGKYLSGCDNPLVKSAIPKS
jgi:curved DNA-binding protein CbpA